MKSAVNVNLFEKNRYNNVLVLHSRRVAALIPKRFLPLLFLQWHGVPIISTQGRRSECDGHCNKKWVLLHGVRLITKCVSEVQLLLTIHKTTRLLQNH